MNFMSNWIKQVAGKQVEEEEQVERPAAFFGFQGTNSNWLDRTPRPERPEMNGPMGAFGIWQGQNTNWLAPDMTPKKPDDKRPIPVMPTSPGGPTRPLPVMPRPPGSPDRPLPVIPQPPGNPMAGVVGGDNEMLMRLMAMFGRR